MLDPSTWYWLGMTTASSVLVLAIHVLLRIMVVPTTDRSDRLSVIHLIFGCIVILLFIYRDLNGFTDELGAYVPPAACILQMVFGIYSLYRVLKGRDQNA